MADIDILNFKNIEATLNELNKSDEYIPVIMEDNYRRVNLTQNLSENYEFKKTFSLKLDKVNLEFISVNSNSMAPFANIINENDFLKIVGATKKGISKRSGRYQESLYGYYLRALNESDEGFLSDVLNKAVIFDNNLKYVKSLMKNKIFMKEWRRNFRKETPVNIFKNNGNLKSINMIKERIF